MMRKEEEIALLLGILGGNNGLKVDPGSFDANRLIRLAERHRVVYALWKYGREKEGWFTGEQLARLENRCRDYAMRSLGQLHELKNIASILNERGIAYACIKGPQLSLMIYGREALKESVDLDILLVHAGDLSQVHELLTKAGYTRSNLNDYTGRFTRKLFLMAKREVHYYNRENHIAIDLHARPGANTYLTAGNFKHLLSGLTTSDLEGTPVPVMPDEAYLAYLCYHGALHQFSRLAWLMDIRAFLHLKKDTLDYDRMLAVARTLRSERHLFLALRLLEDYFSEEIPGPLSERIPRTPRMNYLARHCRQMIGKEERYELSRRGRFGKLAYMMVLIRGLSGKLDLLFGIVLRFLMVR